MRHIDKVLFVIVGLLLVCMIQHNVEQQDVCRTIQGCFALYLWFKYKNP